MGHRFDFGQLFRVFGIGYLILDLVGHSIQRLVGGAVNESWHSLIQYGVTQATAVESLFRNNAQHVDSVTIFVKQRVILDGDRGSRTPLQQQYVTVAIVLNIISVTDLTPTKCSL